MSTYTGSSLAAGWNTHVLTVSPVMAGRIFDTARRKKAAANIFADVKQDALLKLFEKAGDLRAAERANSIVSHGNDPDRVVRALKALQQDKKDKFLLINGLRRTSLRLRWSCSFTSTTLTKTKTMMMTMMDECGKRVAPKTVGFLFSYGWWSWKVDVHKKSWRLDTDPGGKVEKLWRNISFFSGWTAAHEADEEEDDDDNDGEEQVLRKLHKKLLNFWAVSVCRNSLVMTHFQHVFNGLSIWSIKSHPFHVQGDPDVVTKPFLCQGLKESWKLVEVCRDFELCHERETLCRCDQKIWFCGFCESVRLNVVTELSRTDALNEWGPSKSGTVRFSQAMKPVKLHMTCFTVIFM